MPIFSRNKPPPPPPISFPVTLLMRRFNDRAAELEHGEVEPLLIRARLADGYRDADLEPLRPERFDALTAALDDGSWRRLALAVSSLDVPGIRQALPGLLAGGGLERQVRAAFIKPAVERSLLTMALIRQSALRTEEFTRAFLAGLGAGISDETPAESRERLERIDYARLVAQAAAARAEAEDRVAYLRKLQDEHEARFARRGKW